MVFDNYDSDLELFRIYDSILIFNSVNDNVYINPGLQWDCHLRCDRKSNELFHVGQVASIAGLRRNDFAENKRVLIRDQWIRNNLIRSIRPAIHTRTLSEEISQRPMDHQNQ